MRNSNSGNAVMNPYPFPLSSNFSNKSAERTVPQPSLTILRNKAQIEEARDIWTRLQRRPNSDIDFFLSVLESSPETVRPHVLVLHRDGVPYVLLAGRVDHIRPVLRIGYLRVPMPRVHQLTFIYGGLMGEPTQEECQFLAAHIFAFLGREKVDTAFFNSLPAGSPLYRALLAEGRTFTMDRRPRLQAHYCLTLARTFTDITHRLSKNARSNLRKAANRAMKTLPGPIILRSMANADELDEMMRDVEYVASKAYQRGLGVGFGNTTAERTRLQLVAGKGHLRLYVLYARGTPCAYLYGTLYQRVLHGDSTGYDPALRDSCVGTYLMMQVFESLCGDPDRREADAFDFGLGDAFYKAKLCDQEWVDASFYLYAPTLRGILLHAYIALVLFIDRAIRAVLGNNLRDRVKTAWRKLVVRMRGEKNLTPTTDDLRADVRA